ncbi:GNAT family N-acetyltransferase [Streptomyces sp. CAU 1734]|uniref:GNAT family N-acetyltransferase n=1 Tax=Streptomyces sp. CAU 1734 TaxID=3140360 RepID=UPI003260B564
MPHLIRRAAEADADALMKLRLEAEDWLAANDIDQWRSPGFRDRALDKWMVDIAAGRTYVAEDDDRTVVGTVTLARPDTDFWTTADGLDDAVYVAKLISTRRPGSDRLGARIIDWAALTARRQGRDWVRLDCDRANRRLQTYYLGEGFAHVRTESPPHRLSGWMAQRPANVTRHPSLPLKEEARPEQLARVGDPAAPPRRHRARGQHVSTTDRR